jgi:hypothetical protein
MAVADDHSGLPVDPLCLLPSARNDSKSAAKKLWERPRSQLRKALGDAADKEKTPDRLESAYKQLIAQSDLNSFDAWRASRWWGRTYFILGLPAAVMSGVAGAVGLANTAGRIPAAIIALAAAGLTAAVTFLHSEINQQRNSITGAAWCLLGDDTRLHLLQYYMERQAKGSQNSAPDTKDWRIAWEVVSELHQRKAGLLRGEISLPADYPTRLGEAKRVKQAAAYSAAGRAVEATALLVRAGADCELLLGSDHPYTIAIRESLSALIAKEAATAE